jgi:hypothetical protein
LAATKARFCFYPAGGTRETSLPEKLGDVMITGGLGLWWQAFCQDVEIGSLFNLLFAIVQHPFTEPISPDSALTKLQPWLQKRKRS